LRISLPGQSSSAVRATVRYPPGVNATARAQVRHALFDYIERFFNRQRLHSSLDYLTPADYEATKTHHHKVAHAA
jgi:transposase InsO family protein